MVRGRRRSMSRISSSRTGRGVSPLPVLGDAQRGEDEWLLLVDDLGQVAERAAVEGTRVHVDVDTAMGVDLAPHFRTARTTSWSVGMSV